MRGRKKYASLGIFYASEYLHKDHIYGHLKEHIMQIITKEYLL